MHGVNFLPDLIEECEWRTMIESMRRDGVFIKALKDGSMENVCSEQFRIIKYFYKFLLRRVTVFDGNFLDGFFIQSCRTRSGLSFVFNSVHFCLIATVINCLLIVWKVRIREQLFAIWTNALIHLLLKLKFLSLIVWSVLNSDYSVLIVFFSSSYCYSIVIQ